MKATHTIALAVAGLAFTSVGLAAERSTLNRRTGLYEPALSDLRKAAERGDRAELTRTASRLGPNRLSKALGDADRRIVLAALEAAPLFAEGVLLLETIVPLLAAADDDVRERAVRSTSALLRDHDRSSLIDWEVSNETVGTACQSLLRIASKDGERLSARLSALQGLADASEYCSFAAPLAELTAKGPSEVRRAAVLALPDEHGTVGPLARNALVAASKDADGKIAAAAGARVCRSRTQIAGATPLRQLAQAAEALPEDVVEILPCLAASKDVADHKVLEQLASSGPPAVRAASKSLK